MTKIKVGIVGYGNLGKGVQYALTQNDDMELVCIFTRRDPEQLQPVINCKVDKIENIENYLGKIDVMLLCLGSATDLPKIAPQIAKLFCTVDTYDNHKQIPNYLKTLKDINIANKTTSIISVGWDPGIFSIARGLFEAVAPEGKNYTFWGRGVSQGHSDALRRISGVKKAIQYTVPIESAINKVREGNVTDFTKREMHLRECYIVLKDGASEIDIEKAVKTMPDYFAEYNCEIHFISDLEFDENHNQMPHGGFVMRSAKSGHNEKFYLELNLKLDSNPEFTSCVLVAYARATYKLKTENKFGTYTILDIPLTYLSKFSCDELYKTLL